MCQLQSLALTSRQACLLQKRERRRKKNPKAKQLSRYDLYKETTILSLEGCVDLILHFGPDGTSLESQQSEKLRQKAHKFRASWAPSPLLPTPSMGTLVKPCFKVKVKGVGNTTQW